MTLRELSTELTAAFQTFEEPALEARHLLLEALSLDLNEWILGAESALTKIELARVDQWKSERLKGVPLAYLAGHKAFYKQDFLIKPGVLVPRPETELVVEVGLARAPGSLKLADFGSGSGCIGLSLLGEIPYSRLQAIDSSMAATDLTTENAKRLGLASRAEVALATVEDWAAKHAESQGSFDLIVANPPYIARGDVNVQASVHAFEPHDALYAEDDGFAAIQSWAICASNMLRAGGCLVMEIGSSQGARTQEILSFVGFAEIEIKKDLAGHDRVVSAFKHG